MPQWIYQLLMSKQDKQIVAQIMSLWLAKPEAFAVKKRSNDYRSWQSIQSDLFDIRFDLDDGICMFGDLRMNAGFFAIRLLRLFSTQQALLTFHEKAAKKLLEQEIPSIKAEQPDNATPEPEFKSQALEQQKTVLLAPFTEDQIRAISGKNVSVKTRNGEVRSGVIKYNNDLLHPIEFMRSTLTLRGTYFTHTTHPSDIMSIEFDG